MSETRDSETDKPESNGKPRFGVNSNFKGRAGRSGAPKGNRNALQHGLRRGKMPKGCEYIENRVNSLCRQVEDALLELKEGINIVDAASVNSILKWERHGLLAAHWLRHEAEKLSPTERLKFSEAIAKASDSRDKALRALNLDVKPEPVTLDSYLTKADGESS